MRVANKVIAIGASTGGVDALELILSALPASMPPILIVLHMQAGMTRVFANHLDSNTRLSVVEAKDGDALEHGKVLIAPSGKHMRVVRRDKQLMLVECKVGPKVEHCIPSATVLFDSVADTCGGNAIGVILTGIGADGSRGLLRMRQKGAFTIGQNEDSCAVYGMPKVAKEINAVQREMPLNQIARSVMSMA